MPATALATPARCPSRGQASQNPRCRLEILRRIPDTARPNLLLVLGLAIPACMCDGGDGEASAVTQDIVVGGTPMMVNECMSGSGGWIGAEQRVRRRSLIYGN